MVTWGLCTSIPRTHSLLGILNLETALWAALVAIAENTAISLVLLLWSRVASRTLNSATFFPYWIAWGRISVIYYILSHLSRFRNDYAIQQSCGRNKKQLSLVEFCSANSLLSRSFFCVHVRSCCDIRVFVTKSWYKAKLILNATAINFLSWLFYAIYHVTN